MNFNIEELNIIDTEDQISPFIGAYFVICGKIWGNDVGL